MCDSSPQQMLIRELEYNFERLKLRIFEKLDALKLQSQKEVLESSKKNSKTPILPSTFSVEALKAFEKRIMREIDSLGSDLSPRKKNFQPAVVHTVEVPANIGFNYGANTYNEKHNMIISCPSNSTVYFYDATDFTQIKQKKKKEIISSVIQMSYCSETDTHLMGCAFGDIYCYNAGTNTISRIMKEGDSFILAITFISRTTFAFSSSKSGKLYYANLSDTKAVARYSKDSDAWYLHNMNNKKVLLSGLANGKIAIYDTCKGSSLPMIASLQAHKTGKYVTIIKSAVINGREYIITGGNDHTIKIWHFIKGKMKLIKVIQNIDDVSTIVYLEDHKMIACTHHKEYIKFFKLPFGKLEATVNVGLNKARNIFLMKDKNLLGVADLARSVIKVVQLHPSESVNKAN